MCGESRFRRWHAVSLWWRQQQQHKQKQKKNGGSDCSRSSNGCIFPRFSVAPEARKKSIEEGCNKRMSGRRGMREKEGKGMNKPKSRNRRRHSEDRFLTEHVRLRQIKISFSQQAKLMLLAIW